MLGMMAVISVGNGAIANEVLKKTKGHALGLGFVAIAFGLAFFLAISMFGHISANVNPAMHFAKALIGRLSWKDALALSVANVCGGFLGGVIVYCLYFAHFSIVPERPSPPRWDDSLVESSYTPPAPTRNAYISYEPRIRCGSNEGRCKVVFRYKTPENSGGDCATGDGGFFCEMERSNSLQVGTLLHEHDKARDPIYGGARVVENCPDPGGCDEPRVKGTETQLADEARPSSPMRSAGTIAQCDVVCESEGQGLAAKEPHPDTQHEGSPRKGLRLRQLAGVKFGGVQLHEALPLQAGSPPRRHRGLGFFSGAARNNSRTALENPELISQLEIVLMFRRPGGLVGMGVGVGRISSAQEALQPAVRSSGMPSDCRKNVARDGITKKDVAVYHGLLVADQNAKLVAFATRPAVLNYTTNTVAEIIGTFSLIWFALMLEERVNLLDTPDAADNLMPILSPLLIGFLVMGLVTGMAGPTGYAANPARDLGPRIAHFVLPIPNKGPSEWYYAFVPIVGPLIGAFLGAAMFFGCIQLNDYPDWFDGETGTFGGKWEL
eukprot:g14748.t1